MTTTSEKLLELAAHYEEKAKALRLAAAELNGHLTTKAKATIGPKLEAAIGLRGRRPPEMMAARRAIVRELVASGVSKTLDLQAALAKRSMNVNQATIITDLAAVGAMKTGSGRDTHWTLGEPAGKHATKRKPAKTGVWAVRIKNNREESAKLLARIASAGKPVTKVGPRIGALVRRGYVEKTPDGYIRTDKAFTI
jgi:hypothetical protein